MGKTRAGQEYTCGVCEGQNPHCLTCHSPEDEATRILRADAEAKGMGWSEYLRSIGVLTPHEERQIRKRERQLKSG